MLDFALIGLSCCALCLFTNVLGAATWRPCVAWWSRSLRKCAVSVCSSRTRQSVWSARRTSEGVASGNRTWAAPNVDASFSVLVASPADCVGVRNWTMQVVLQLLVYFVAVQVPRCVPHPVRCRRGAAVRLLPAVPHRRLQGVCAPFFSFPPPLLFVWELATNSLALDFIHLGTGLRKAAAWPLALCATMWGFLLAKRPTVPRAQGI